MILSIAIGGVQSFRQQVLANPDEEMNSKTLVDGLSKRVKEMVSGGTFEQSLLCVEISGF